MRKLRIRTCERTSYQGSKLNKTNSTSCEIQARIIGGNRSLELKIYIPLIRRAATYGCETWTLTSRNEQQLRIFERKILRKIFGPVQDENLENQKEA